MGRQRGRSKGCPWPLTSTLLRGAGCYHLGWKLKTPSPVPGSSAFLALEAFPHLWIRDSPLWPLTSMRIIIVTMITKARVSLSHWKMNDPRQPKDTQTEAKACVHSAPSRPQAAGIGDAPSPAVFKLYKSLFKLRCCFFQQLLTRSLIYKPDRYRELHP